MTYSSGGVNPQQDYEVWGPVNLIYRPISAQTPAIKAEVLNTATSYDVFKKEVKDNFVRDIPMHRDFNNMLLLSVSPISSCLHVIDGALPVYSETEALLTRQVGEYSHIDRIVPTGAPIPPLPFWNRTRHDWCYYYQKASLARQLGDWQAIKDLYKQTKKLKLNTSDKSELIPFLEGLVNVGDYEEAEDLFKQIRGNAEMRLPLCNSLSEDPGYPPEFGYDYEAINTSCSSTVPFSELDDGRLEHFFEIKRLFLPVIDPLNCTSASSSFHHSIFKTPMAFHHGCLLSL
jgi:hypothetical protein